MADNAGADWPEWPVCTLTAVEASGAVGFLVGDGDWPFRGFVVSDGETLRAYANICPHRQHPLDATPDQFLVDEHTLIRCGSHGALFEPRTGKCVFGPCAGDRLLRLPLRISDSGEVLVRAPDNLHEAIGSAQKNR